MSDVTRRVITVDGPAASGKSTVARRLAERLGYRYINSGAFYRALGLKLSQLGLPIDEDESVQESVQAIAIGMSPCGDRTLVDGEDVSVELRSKRVTELSARVACLPSVRRRVNDALRQMARESSVVVDGRDIGTVVFPCADFKIYLDASLEERARRRLLDYQGSGVVTTLEQLVDELSRRDRSDSTRPLAPLVPSGEAVVVNSTGRTVEAVVDELLGAFRQRFPSAAPASQTRDPSCEAFS